MQKGFYKTKVSRRFHTVPTHRHERTSWIIASGAVVWCFCCGAWKYMKEESPGVGTPYGKWHKPSGNPKTNPWNGN